MKSVELCKCMDTAYTDKYTLASLRVPKMSCLAKIGVEYRYNKNGSWLVLCIEPLLAFFAFLFPPDRFFTLSVFCVQGDVLQTTWGAGVTDTLSTELHQVHWSWVCWAWWRSRISHGQCHLIHSGALSHTLPYKEDGWWCPEAVLVACRGPWGLQALGKLLGHMFWYVRIDLKKKYIRWCLEEEVAAQLFWRYHLKIITKLVMV